MDFNSQDAAWRMKQLEEVAETYFESLRKKNFDTIPYDENASLRAPLTPGGVNVPIVGIEAIRNQWWLPLEPALNGVIINVLGHYFHDNLSGVICEAEIILASPSVKLRVADRFSINKEGKITGQENHFDPREVTGG